MLFCNFIFLRNVICTTYVERDFGAGRRACRTRRTFRGWREFPMVEKNVEISRKDRTTGILVSVAAFVIAARDEKSCTDIDGIYTLYTTCTVRVPCIFAAQSGRVCKFWISLETGKKYATRLCGAPPRVYRRMYVTGQFILCASDRRIRSATVRRRHVLWH